MNKEIEYKHSKKVTFLRYFGCLLIFVFTFPFGIILGSLLALGVYFWRKTQYLKLGKQSIIVKKGLITSTLTEIPYKKINSIKTYRGIMGNMFGYGNIGIFSANATTPEIFANVDDPEEIRLTIQKRIK